MEYSDPWLHSHLFVLAPVDYFCDKSIDKKYLNSARYTSAQ